MNPARPTFGPTLRPIPKPEYRLGVLVPPANPTVELEFSALINSETALHSMRLPVIPGDLDARNAGYVASYSQAIKGFGSLKLDAISVAMTGPQYRLLYSGDVDLCKRLSDQAGVPVETASFALCESIRALGINKLSLLSPYPDWLTKLAVAYWNSAGFEVEHIRLFEDKLVAYSVTPAQVIDALDDTPVEVGDAIVMSGTGMRTLEAVAQFREKSSTHVVSSNVCSVWSLSRALRGEPSDWLRAVVSPTLLESVL